MLCLQAPFEVKPLHADLIRQLARAEHGNRPSVEALATHPCWLSDPELVEKCVALSNYLEPLDKVSSDCLSLMLVVLPTPLLQQPYSPAPPQVIPLLTPPGNP